jgi:hypothetical protein
MRVLNISVVSKYRVAKRRVTIVGNITLSPTYNIKNKRCVFHCLISLM